MSSGGAGAAGAFTSSGATGTVTITDTSANGGNLKITGDGGTTPSKYIRVHSGNLEIVNSAYGAIIATLTDAGALSVVAGLSAFTGTAIAAGAATQFGVKFSSTSNFGVFYGSGAPTFTAAANSLYLRSDGSTTTTRLYVNTTGSTTWATVTTSA
jgi:hypothetical protein